MTKPTLFGGGEAGAEAIMPLDPFWAKLDRMADGIYQMADGQGITVNVYGTAGMDVEELADALDKNAAAASDQYKGQYIELTGRLDNIDSDGKYIGVGVLDENDYEHMFSDVQCYIKNDDQMNIIKTMATGDEIVVKGKVTSVGEVIGYAMDIDELSAK